MEGIEGEAIYLHTVQRVSLAISADEHVKFILRDWMIRWANFSFPAYF